MNGEGTHLQPSAPPTPTDSTPAEKKVANSAAECELNGRDHRVPVTYPGEMGLSKGVKDQYSQNPFYKIMHAPKAFKNFEVSDGFLSACICAIGWCSACSVPNIQIRKRRLQISIINQAHLLFNSASGSPKNALLPAGVFGGLQRRRRHCFPCIVCGFDPQIIADLRAQSRVLVLGACMKVQCTT